MLCEKVSSIVGITAGAWILREGDFRLVQIPGCSLDYLSLFLPAFSPAGCKAMFCLSASWKHCSKVIFCRGCYCMIMMSFSR